MTKSLEQIQEENRKFILKSIYGCVIGKPLTLSKVLLAIIRHGCYYDELWLDDELKTLEFDLKGVSFDLTKETLEEQTEETQRGINELFND